MPTSTRARLLTLLADGRFHSGAALGESLALTRAAVCKAVAALNVQAVEIHSVPGRGYRLVSDIRPLDADRLRRTLSDLEVSPLPEIQCFEALPSTSRHLLEQKGQPEARLCLAEYQSAGRGRRGRRWVASPWRNLLMSLAVRQPIGPAALAGFSLVAGLSAVEALATFGYHDITLKWPNDLLRDGRKLAGLLLDVRGEAAGPTDLVIGIGVNLCLLPADGADIDQPWADLTQSGGALPDQNLPDRNLLAARITARWLTALDRYALHGFSPFVAAWRERDALLDRRVRLVLPDREIAGISRGVDDQGALLLEQGGRVRAWQAGEVRLRAA